MMSSKNFQLKVEFSLAMFIYKMNTRTVEVFHLFIYRVSDNTKKCYVMTQNVNEVK